MAWYMRFTCTRNDGKLRLHSATGNKENSQMGDNTVFDVTTAFYLWLLPTTVTNYFSRHVSKKNTIFTFIAIELTSVVTILKLLISFGALCWILLRSGGDDWKTFLTNVTATWVFIAFRRGMYIVFLEKVKFLLTFTSIWRFISKHYKNYPHHHNCSASWFCFVNVARTSTSKWK